MAGGKWAAVIGSPIEHSLSPVLHSRAYELAGIDMQYRRFEVDGDSLGQFMADLPPECVGLSVTMPCKGPIANYLDNVDPLAKAIGAVNTVICAGGLRSGFNTDVRGIVGALVDANPGELRETGTAAAQAATILGTGATAASALVALTQMGIRNVSVVGRRFGVQTAVGAAAQRLHLEYSPLNWRNLELVAEQVNAADVVVSTVPPEVCREVAALVHPRPQATFLDVTYAEAERPLPAAFRAAGAHLASPLAMLVHQGLAQVKLMTGREVPFQPVMDAIESAAK